MRGLSEDGNLVHRLEDPQPSSMRTKRSASLSDLTSLEDFDTAKGPADDSALKAAFDKALRATYDVAASSQVCVYIHSATAANCVSVDLLQTF